MIELLINKTQSITSLSINIIYIIIIFWQFYNYDQSIYI